ncbi:MAG TPA: TVP38/TMEM64 family protein [Thermoanaerobaculia bacterium]
MNKPVVKIVLGFLVLAALAVAMRLLPVASWLEQFKGWVQGVGPAGYVLYAAAYIICCVFIIPAFALTIGAGAIFGFVKGAIIVIIGATIGATCAFLLGRSVLRRKVESMTAGNAKFRALDRAITTEGTKIMWLVRLSGFPPFTWVNYAFGLTGVKLRDFILTTFIGIIPGTLAFTYAGAAGAAAVMQKSNRIALIVTAIGAVLVSVFIARIALRAIRRAGVEEV